jgi:hypothetical protein
VTRLKNGTSYTVKVKDAAGFMKSGYSASVNVIPGLPTAPTGVSASAGTGHATVSFTVPNDNGSAITGYKVNAADSTNSAHGHETAAGRTSRSLSPA